MEEQATFEARAVLAPRRARMSRLMLLLPLVALVGVVWVGIDGPPVDKGIAEAPQPSPLAAASSAEPRPEHPATALGLEVQQLGDLQPHGFARDHVLAIAGWYVPTAITDCPPLPALYHAGSLPYLRGDTDTYAFCVRSGVLYDTKPATSIEDKRATSGISAIPATVVSGVIMPMDLELAESDGMEVVVLGRFIPSGDACTAEAVCQRELLVDYLAWTAGT
jgi:hypothetical protein